MAETVGAGGDVVVQAVAAREAVGQQEGAFAPVVGVDLVLQLLVAGGLAAARGQQAKGRDEGKCGACHGVAVLKYSIQK